jgi:two-component system cell cycle response regulator
MRFWKSYKVIGLLLGIVLGFGAPLGSLILRGILAGHFGLAWMRSEASAQPFFYVYMVAATPAVFAAFGLVFGWLADRVIAQNAALGHLNRVLERQTMLDEVTGLLNRRQLDVEIEREIERARRYRHPIAGIMIDVDDFKQINDTRGHLMGDVALKKIAAVVRASIRKVDVAGRYGGDEFLVLLPEAVMDSARTVAIRIQEGIRQCKIDVPRPSLSLTASIGLFAFPDCGFLDRKVFIETVDVALLKAKKAGKNRIVSG